MNYIWKIALRNILKNRRRHFATGSSLAVGFVAVVLLGAYMVRIERYLATQAIYLNYVGHVAIYQKDGLDKHLSQPRKYNISLETQEKLEQFFKSDSRIENTNKILHGSGLINNGISTFPFLMTAIDPQMQEWSRHHPQVQRYVPELTKYNSGDAFWKSNTVFPINVATGLSNILQTQSPHAYQLVSNGFESGMALADVDVVGVYTTGMSFSDEAGVTTGLVQAQNFYGTDRVTSVSVFLKNESDLKAFKKDLLKYIGDNQLPLDIYDYHDERVSTFYVGAMNFLYVMIGFFVALVCSIVVISISNSLYISLMERKSELGMLRSIGFKQQVIARIFVYENLILSLISFFVATVLGLLISVAVNSTNIRFTIPGVAGDLQFILQPGVSFTLGIAFILLVLVLATSKLGTRRFLKRSILDLLGSAQ